MAPRSSRTAVLQRRCEKLSEVGLSGLSSPGTPRSDWAAGANAGRCFAGCDVGSATGTTLRKVSPGTGRCSGLLQLAGAGEKGHRSESSSFKTPACSSSVNARGHKWVLAKKTPRGGSQRSFSPNCRLGATPRAKLIATAAQTRQVNPSQQNAQWHHKPGTRRQFSSFPHHFLITNKEHSLFHLKNRLHHLNDLSLSKTNPCRAVGAQLPTHLRKTFSGLVSRFKNRSTDNSLAVLNAEYCLLHCLVLQENDLTCSL